MKRHAFNHADGHGDVDLILTGSEGNSVVAKQWTCEDLFGARECREGGDGTLVAQC